MINVRVNAKRNVNKQLYIVSDRRDPRERLDRKDPRAPRHKAAKARQVQLVSQAQRDRLGAIPGKPVPLEAPV